MSVEIRTSIQPYIIRNIEASEGTDAGQEVDTNLGCHGRQELSDDPELARALFRSKRAAKHDLMRRRFVLVHRESNSQHVDYLGWQHRMVAVVCWRNPPLR